MEYERETLKMLNELMHDKHNGFNDVVDRFNKLDVDRHKDNYLKWLCHNNYIFDPVVRKVISLKRHKPKYLKWTKNDKDSKCQDYRLDVFVGKVKFGKYTKVKVFRSVLINNFKQLDE